MKKIIFVHLLNDFSGSPKVLSQVIKTFKDKGHPIELFTGKSNVGFLTGLTANHHFFVYKRFNTKLGTLFSFLFSQIQLFFKILKFRNEEVVIYVNTLLPFGAALAGKLMGKPVIYHIHETYIRPRLLKKFLRGIVQNTASKIVFVSKSLQKEERFNGLREYLIYNALPTSFLSAAKKKVYIPVDKKNNFKVLMICSLRLYKGVNEFMAIAKRCEENKSIQFQLVLNAEPNEVTTFFDKTIVPPNLEILPKQKNVAPYYETASLVLNLSKIDECVETFGLTIIEAMGYGIPVIVPPVGGPAEIVRDGMEGYLVSSYEIEAIAQKIIDLSIAPELCLQLSENAKQRANDFNEKSFEEKILNCMYE